MMSLSPSLREGEADEAIHPVVDCIEPLDGLLRCARNNAGGGL